MSEVTKEDYAAFLKKETEKLERSTLYTWVIGLSLGAFLIIYFSVILFMVQTFCDPDNAASYVSLTVEENAPDLIRKAEVSLGLEAPRMANRVSDTFLHLIPQLTAAGKQQIDLLHQDMLPYVSKQLQAIITEYIHAHSSEFAAFAEASDNQAFVDQFTDEMMETFAQAFVARMAHSYDIAQYDQVSEHILTVLEAMNLQLDTLQAKAFTEMDRREQLQVRLLASLTKVLAEGN